MALPPPSPEGTAVVTGASSGIGAALARALAARGHGLTLVARRADRLEALAAELRARHGVEARVAPADLADAAARDALAAEAEQAGKTVEILVNAAGFGVYDAFATTSRERELDQVRLLVEAPLDLTHRWLPGMVARRRGAVVNISSTSAFQALPYNAGYAAAKAHVLLLSEALWAEVRDDGVTVTVVCPGPVPTEFQRASDAAFADRLPQALWVDAERVAHDALAGVEAGRRVVIPGGVVPRAAFAPNRYAPRGVALAVAKRLMAR
jgi:short-subunit dehydrogenase